MKVRLQLYTVPGQVFYNATRKLVLKGVDGVVFVADSQVAAEDTNIESLSNLKTNLAELGLSVDQVPVVFQFNKRDIRNIQPVEVLNEALNPDGAPFFEAAALHGVGVFETLKAISRLAIGSVRKKVGPEAAHKATAAAPGRRPPAPPAVAPPPVRLTPAPEAAPALADASPLASLVPDTADDVRVEFAEQDAGEHQVVRPVTTKATVDIQKELEGLRAMATAAAARAPVPGPSREMERRLQDVLVREAEARQDVKRKATLEVPGRLLKDASAMKIHLAFGEDGQESWCATP
jgi:hypothetical protein